MKDQPLMNGRRVGKDSQKLSFQLLNFSPMDSNFPYHQVGISISRSREYIASLSQD
jgi:hypothetical protein